MQVLSCTGEHYEYAIAQLKQRYYQPRQVRELYVQKIVHLSQMKEGTGQKLQKMHDDLSQTMTAIRKMEASKDDQFGCFITSLVQSKFDQATSFAW